MGTALDPSGLLAGTREVYWWAGNAVFTATGPRSHVATSEQIVDSRLRGVEPSRFRLALLDAWAFANRHEHDRLRLAFPEYAGAILMWQLGGIEKVAGLLDALEQDVADLAEQRRVRSEQRRGYREEMRRG